MSLGSAGEEVALEEEGEVPEVSRKLYADPDMSSEAQGGLPSASTTR
jgi:hypothetical protein